MEFVGEGAKERGDIGWSASAFKDVEEGLGTVQGDVPEPQINIQHDGEALRHRAGTSIWFPRNVQGS